ncbi:hypothetical protein NDU88_002602 [Pleurodeles waltl]|uniref:Uncharacterized protein n=1 Tax=Pleurodeles waltl TaxID=8319 RepID=A0AAV7UA80_PLEWA|nr:hypothetical protein NDU88_002602 [Pleurodeles waltl]
MSDWCAPPLQPGGRAQEAEDSIATLKTEMAVLQCQVKELTCTSHVLEVRLKDYEGCSWLNNVKIMEVPERAGGLTMDLLVEELIQKNLQPQGCAKFVSVEWAYRVPGTSLKPGGSQRTILACIFNYRDREVTLQAA